MQFFGGSTVTDSSLLPAAPPGTGAGGPGNNAHMIYVFNRAGVCLLYREWNRPLRTLDLQQDHKLMFGLLFSLRSFTAKIDPTTAEKGNLGVPLLAGQGCSFYSFKTNTYQLNFMETPSGIKVEDQTQLYLFGNTGFVYSSDKNLTVCSIHASTLLFILITHPKTGDQRESLKYIYNLYVEYVVKNPLYIPGTPIQCDLFTKNLDQYVRTLI